jgi:membrane fusion protein, multidrug efflux system
MSGGDSNDDLGFDLPPPARPSGARLALIVAVVVIALGGAFAVGFLPRYRAKKELATATETVQSAVLRVQVLSPKAKSSDRAMALPGSVQALQETTVYPRSSGYVRTWKADIGDTVKEGALLAEIDTPEIDQQLGQARAQLAQAVAGLTQAKANRGYARTNLDRVTELAPKGVTSQQELDKARSQSVVDDASVEVAEANVEAQKANIRRLTEMQSFSRVLAPFSGTVNFRSVERGMLVSPVTPLFKVSQSDTVRVFVQVPQGVATNITVGLPAHVTVREYGGRIFEGKVARSAGSLDPSSRTMNTEIRVPNEKHELIGGMYAQVALTLPSPHRVWELPATSVLTDAKGVRVAVIDDGKVHLVPVTIERDNGATMEIASGINDGDAIVKLASSELVEGRPVRVAP